MHFGHELAPALGSVCQGRWPTAASCRACAPSRCAQHGWRSSAPAAAARGGLGTVRRPGAGHSDQHPPGRLWRGRGASGPWLAGPWGGQLQLPAEQRRLQRRMSGLRGAAAQRLRTRAQAPGPHGQRGGRGRPGHAAGAGHGHGQGRLAGLRAVPAARAGRGCGALAAALRTRGRGAAAACRCPAGRLPAAAGLRRGRRARPRPRAPLPARGVRRERGRWARAPDPGLALR
mmetsp:Transcript_107115/g.332837  ORF Transcript_107115/g.332837 Transcript_107115/m.332837 type:complete len:231 (-) Transcript_107115:445-1137(-)